MTAVTQTVTAYGAASPRNAATIRGGLRDDVYVPPYTLGRTNSRRLGNFTRAIVVTVGVPRNDFAGPHCSASGFRFGMGSNGPGLCLGDWLDSGHG